ncbi:MAG: hypothetical protein NZ874_06420 [Fimbriimonadales bacterium]|nr:hypothetical protein [Fimbriimonadales bacterium]
MARCLGCGTEMGETQELYCPRCAVFAGVSGQSSTTEHPGAFSKIVPTRNPAALAGYYLGVFSLIPCLGVLLAPFAVGFGIVGLRNARDLPQQIGRVHAIVALVLGGISLLLHLLCIGYPLAAPLIR